MCGKAASFDKAKGRYRVRLDGDVGRLAFKPEHLTHEAYATAQ